MSKQKTAGVGFFERYLTLWVIICMVIGVLIGKFLPSIPAFLGRFEYAQVIGLREKSAFASQCVECGKCEQHCPQHIAIRAELKKADKELRPIPYKIGIEVARKYFMRKHKAK